VPRPTRRLAQTWQATENGHLSFGTELREERERQGVGLSAIAERTKVSERYLRALEEDAYDQLPGGIFNKGIVRGYCQQLGLDEEEWLRRFAESFEDAGGEPDWNSFAENVRRNRELVGASRRRWWGVALMVLALIALGWVAWHYVVKPRMGLPKPDAPVVGMVVSRAYSIKMYRVMEREHVPAAKADFLVAPKCPG
jgi:cytoskeleton protein RodZ